MGFFRDVCYNKKVYGKAEKDKWLWLPGEATPQYEIT